MNREYNSRVSSKNIERLLKNLKNTTGVYFFLPHPVYTRCMERSVRTIIRAERPRRTAHSIAIAAWRCHLYA